MMEFSCFATASGQIAYICGMRWILAFLWIAGVWATGWADVPAAVEVTGADVPVPHTGSVRRFVITSENLKDDITVDIWTPEGYDDGNDGVRYPVVYAHDGQNLFDGRLAFAGVAWEIDKAAWRLASDGSIEAPVIVGINNRGSKNLRANDYFPEKVIDYIPAADRDKTKIFDTCKDGFMGDEEAAFVATELKPFVDSRYRTDPSRSHTFAMGSSMGGLASLYLMCEYPELFGGAACMSTHWIGSLDLNPDYTMNDDPVCARAILDYMKANLPSPADHRLYLDQGTTGWDAGYLGYEQTARQIAIDAGYSVENGTLGVYDAAGAGHNEWYWQQRVWRPLQFLLDRKRLESGVPCVTAGSGDGRCRYVDLSGRTVEHPERGRIYISVMNGATAKIRF